MHIFMSTEYAKILKSQLTHGLEFENKYILSTINKMLRVELGMIRREIKKFEDFLIDFEKRYNMSSEEFYEKFNAGELGDDREYMRWYAYKDTYNKLIERKKEIERIVHA